MTTIFSIVLDDQGNPHLVMGDSLYDLPFGKLVDICQLTDQARTAIRQRWGKDNQGHNPPNRKDKPSP